MACRHQNPTYHQFCTQCGVKLPRNRCVCGFLNNQAALFCGGCGTTMLTEDPAAAPPQGRSNDKVDLESLLVSLQWETTVGEDTAKITQSDIIKMLKNKS